MKRQPASLKLTFIHFSRSHCATGSVSPSQAISQCHHTHCQSMALLVSGLTHRPKTHVHIVQLSQSLHLMQCNSVSLSISCNATQSVSPSHAMQLSQSLHRMQCNSVSLSITCNATQSVSPSHAMQLSQSLHLMQCNSVSLSISCNKSTSSVGDPHTHCQSVDHLVSVLTNRPKTHVHNVQFSQSLHLRQSVNIVSSPLTHTAMALLVSVLTLICPFKK